MSTVNIMMATYMGAVYLREQLDSILRSTYTDWSLYVQDDASTDETAAILKEYHDKYPERIVYYRNEQAMGAVQNFLSLMTRISGCLAGKAAESGQATSNEPAYFMLCDQDDVWLPDKIEKTLAHMKRLERKYGKDKPALVFTDARVVDESLAMRHASFLQSSHYRVKRPELSRLLMGNMCIGCTVMINRALLSYVREAPQNARYHDWWLALLAVTFGHIGCLPKVTMYYRQHGGNVVGSARYLQYVTERLYHLKRQKQALEACRLQAEEFLVMYGTQMDEEARETVSAFVRMFRQSLIRKRGTMLRYHFYKSGFLRNVGLFLIL